MNRLTLSLMFLLLAVAMVFSCGKRADAAADYNDKIIRFESEIMTSFDKLDSAMKEPSRLAPQMDYAYLNLKTTISHALLALDSIGPFREDPEFQISARSFFHELNGMAENDYGKLIAIVRTSDSLYTKQLADSALVIKERIERQFEASLQRFMSTQEAFGKKYHIIFE